MLRPVGSGEHTALPTEEKGEFSRSGYFRNGVLWSKFQRTQACKRLVLGLRASLGSGQLVDRRMGRTVEQPKNSVELLVDMLQGRVWHDDTNEREPLQKERVEQTGNCKSKKLFLKLFFERLGFTRNLTARRLKLLLHTLFVHGKIDVPLFLFCFDIAPQQINAKGDQG